MLFQTGNGAAQRNIRQNTMLLTTTKTTNADSTEDIPTAVEECNKNVHFLTLCSFIAITGLQHTTCKWITSGSKKYLFYIH